MFLKGNASGKRVALHITVKRNLFPDLVFGKGPTQSIMSLENGSSVTCIDLKGAFPGPWLGFPIIWHV